MGFGECGGETTARDDWLWLTAFTFVFAFACVAEHASQPYRMKHVA